MIGERAGGSVHLFVQCGMCKIRIPLEPEDDARALLDAHLYCAHDVRADAVAARSGQEEVGGVVVADDDGRRGQLVDQLADLGIQV